MTYPYRPAYAEPDPPTYKDEATGASLTVAPRARWEGEEWAFPGWLDTSHWTEGPARMALLWSDARPDELTTAYDDHGQVKRQCWQCWRCGRWSDAVQLNGVDVWVCSRLHDAATCRSKSRGGDSTLAPIPQRTGFLEAKQDMPWGPLAAAPGRRCTGLRSDRGRS